MQRPRGASTTIYGIVYPMVSLGLLTMADTLAARETHTMQKHTYNHTEVACMMHKEGVPTFRPRLPARTNILCLSRAPRSTLIDPVRSVHMCESSGRVRPVQMAGEVCVVIGPNGLGGFE